MQIFNYQKYAREMSCSIRVYSAFDDDQRLQKYIIFPLDIWSEVKSSSMLPIWCTVHYIAYICIWWGLEIGTVESLMRIEAVQSMMRIWEIECMMRIGDCNIWEKSPSTAARFGCQCRAWTPSRLAPVCPCRLNSDARCTSFTGLSNWAN